MATVGLLHPGAMGAAIGRLLRRAGHDVAWVRAGRSVETTRRAQDADLRPVAGLRVLAKECPVVLSVCPPENAVEVARELANEGFKGTYVDANAISPSAAAWIESIVTTSGGTFVDAGIVGPPPVTAGSTRLFLSGSAAGSIAKLFQGTALEPVVVGERVGAASAAKLAYAGWTKATSALLLALRSYARAWDVEAALLDEWRRSQPELPERASLVEVRAIFSWSAICLFCSAICCSRPYCLSLRVSIDDSAASLSARLVLKEPSTLRVPRLRAAATTRCCPNWSSRSSI